MSRIRRLPPFIANQIAAGEVIERPASVVKELLENALDAQATQIHIQIGYGGLNLIQVSDNGTGIVAQDLALAVASHATSKIQKLEDLYAITSLGFRGEALASIASVSRMIIRSKTAEDRQATMLEVVGEELIYNPCARSDGTTVEVHDIFFNAPVRKKFLKSAQSECQAIDRVARCFAMSAPTVGISLSHDEKLLWEVSPAYTQSAMVTRITKLLGKKFTDDAHFVAVEHGGMTLQGWLGGAAYQRSQNDAMWFYLNHRMVRDKLLFHAIKQAYAPVLHPGRYPGCLIYLSLDPSEVDVNVHPTKHEVRFQQPRLIHDFIISQITPLWRMNATPLSQEASSTTTHHYNEIEQESRLSLNDGAVRAGALAQDLQDGIGVVTKAIDSRFSLLWQTGSTSAYVVDIPVLSKHWWLQRLLVLPRPWERRRLSITLWVPDLFVDPHRHAEHRLCLEELGIETALSADNVLQILTVPTALSQLDFQRVLRQLFDSVELSLENRIAILAEGIAHDGSGLAEDAQHNQSFRDFMWDACQQAKGGTRILSSALCEGLLYAS